MKVSKEQRVKAVQLALGGAPVAQVAKELGVSPSLVYRWIKAYKGTQKAPEGFFKRLFERVQRALCFC